jgi:hypothetical protein
MKDKGKDKRIALRLTKADFIFLECTAKVYADGNISEWIRHCIKNYEPKYLKKRGGVVARRPRAK